MTEHSVGDVAYAWRGTFENKEVNALHAAAFGHRVLADDWQSQLERYSLGWVCARLGDELVGFVNVPWDGGHPDAAPTLYCCLYASPHEPERRSGRRAV